MKRILPGPSLPNAVTPFYLLFGREPRTSLDALAPQLDGDDLSAGNLETFVEERRHTFREVRKVLEKRHADRERSRQKANSSIRVGSPGATAH